MSYYISIDLRLPEQSHPFEVTDVKKHTASFLSRIPVYMADVSPIVYCRADGFVCPVKLLPPPPSSYFPLSISIDRSLQPLSLGWNGLMPVCALCRVLRAFFIAND